MVRIVGDIRVISYLSPVAGRNFVAGIASFLVLFGSVRESGVIDWSLPGRWWTSRSTRPSFLSTRRATIGELLRINKEDESRQRESEQCDSVAFHSIIGRAPYVFVHLLDAGHSGRRFSVLTHLMFFMSLGSLFPAFASR